MKSVQLTMVMLFFINQILPTIQAMEKQHILHASSPSSVITTLPDLYPAEKTNSMEENNRLIAILEDDEIMISDKAKLLRKELFSHSQEPIMKLLTESKMYDESEEEYIDEFYQAYLSYKEILFKLFIEKDFTEILEWLRDNKIQDYYIQVHGMNTTLFDFLIEKLRKHQEKIHNIETSKKYVDLEQDQIEIKYSKFYYLNKLIKGILMKPTSITSPGKIQAIEYVAEFQTFKSDNKLKYSALNLVNAVGSTALNTPLARESLIEYINRKFKYYKKLCEENNINISQLDIEVENELEKQKMDLYNQIKPESEKIREEKERQDFNDKVQKAIQEKDEKEENFKKLQASHDEELKKATEEKQKLEDKLKELEKKSEGSFYRNIFIGAASAGALGVLAFFGGKYIFDHK